MSVTYGATDPACAVAGELRAAASDSAALPYLSVGDRVVTYAEQWHAVRRFAAGLVAGGLRSGDVVAVWASNDLASATAMQAVVAAGGTVVPLNTRYTSFEARDIASRAHSVMVMAPETLLGRRYVDEAGDLVEGAAVVCLEGRAPEGVTSWLDVADSGTEASLAEVERRIDTMDGSEIAIVQFTSGSTGVPKGARLRQGPILASARTWSEVAGLHPGDAGAMLYPLSHVGGFKTGLTSTLAARASLALMPVVSKQALLEEFERRPLTFLPGPPPILRELVEAYVAGRLANSERLRVVITGSQIVPPQLVRDLKSKIGVTDVINAYGLTEASGVCTMTRLGDDLELVCTTLGRAIPGVELRVAEPDESGAGELEVRAATVMAGYLDDDAATVHVLHDGWLRTGDTGSVGEDGYVRIAGRASELVVVGGYNVYPAEVERVLELHPAVAEAAVVGVPDDRLGEVPVAFVVRSEEPFDIGELQGWAVERLANFKRPRAIWTVDALPRADLGKIAKPRLRELAAERISGLADQSLSQRSRP